MNHHFKNIKIKAQLSRFWFLFSSNNFQTYLCGDDIYNSYYNFLIHYQRFNTFYFLDNIILPVNTHDVKDFVFFIHKSSFLARKSQYSIFSLFYLQESNLMFSSFVGWPKERWRMLRAYLKLFEKMNFVVLQKFLKLRTLNPYYFFDISNNITNNRLWCRCWSFPLAFSKVRVYDLFQKFNIYNSIAAHNTVARFMPFSYLPTVNNLFGKFSLEYLREKKYLLNSYQLSNIGTSQTFNFKLHTTIGDRGGYKSSFLHKNGKSFSYINNIGFNRYFFTRLFSSSRLSTTTFTNTLSELQVIDIFDLMRINWFKSQHQKYSKLRFKGDYLRELDYDWRWCRRLQKGAVISRRIFDFLPAILKLWARVTQKVSYYSPKRKVLMSGNDTLQVLLSAAYDNRVLNSNMRTRSVDINKFNSIFLRLPQLRGLKLNLKFKGFNNNRLVVNIPIYYDNSFVCKKNMHPQIFSKCVSVSSTGISNKPKWSAFDSYNTADINTTVALDRFVNKSTKNFYFFDSIRGVSDRFVAVYDPYTNNTYLINSEAVAWINFKLINLSARVEVAVTKAYIWYTYALDLVGVCFLKLYTRDMNILSHKRNDAVASGGRHFIKNILSGDLWSKVVNSSSHNDMLLLKLKRLTTSFKNRASYFNNCLPRFRKGLIQFFQSRLRFILASKRVKFYKRSIFELLSGEFNLFSWKFFNRRWYFLYSRWIKAAALQKLVQDVLGGRYRRLTKGVAFSKLFKLCFYKIWGLTDSQFWVLWRYARSGYNSWQSAPIMQRFSLLLGLKLDSLVLMLGLADNRGMSQELISLGSLRIDGSVITNYNYLISFSSILQVELGIISKLAFLNGEKSLSFLPPLLFLQSLWSMMLFKLVRWPFPHELIFNSIMTERWIRFYIRHFSRKISKQSPLKGER